MSNKSLEATRVLRDRTKFAQLAERARQDGPQLVSPVAWVVTRCIASSQCIIVMLDNTLLMQSCRPKFMLCACRMRRCPVDM